MNVTRSALTANVVSGLPNVRDYIHKNRQRLMEERRLRALQIEVSSEESVSNRVAVRE